VTLINTSNPPDDDYGIYRADATPGSLVKIQREFVSIFGIGVINLDRIPAINNAGQVITHRRPLGLIGGNRDQYLISDGTASTTITLFGVAAPDGNGTFSDSLRFEPAFNDAGEAAFFASIDNTSGGLNDNVGLFRSDGATTVQIVREGDTAPNGVGTFSLSISSFYALNTAGQVSFRGTLFNTSDDKGIFRGSGGAVTRIARTGQSAPNGNGSFSGFVRPVNNESGEAAFLAILTGTSGGTNDDSGIFRGSGGTPVQIVREGQGAPDGNGTYRFFILGPVLLPSAHLFSIRVEERLTTPASFAARGARPCRLSAKARTHRMTMGLSQF